MMAQLGRYLEMTRAVVPDLVTVIMALACRSWAEVTGGVADGAGHIGGGGVGTLAEAALVVNAGLGPHGNARHGLHGLQGIHARGGFPGEHNGAGAVVNGVGHVGGFRPGGAGRLHHGVQHLRGGDGRLARGVALFDEELLQDGDFLQGNFHAHVTPGHHDGVRYPEDLVQCAPHPPCFQSWR